MAGVIQRLKMSRAFGAGRSAKDRFARLYFERGLIDTGEQMDLDQVELDAPGRQRYEASGWTYLRRALRRCEVGAGDVFVDFGSGKGRVVWQAAQYRFDRVIGIEISPELNAVARANIEGNPDRLTCRNVELITGDATELDVPDDVTFAYFFSPFEGEVFAQVMERIVESLDRNPRSLTLIYANPVMGKEVLESGRFELLHVLKGVRPDVGETGWVNVYSSRGGSQA